jgi:hypothetical protein
MAITGILKSFERRLQMLDPRLQRLKPAVPIDLRDRGLERRPAAASPPHSTHPLCNCRHPRIYRP